MDKRERELYELGNQVAAELSSLPDDGFPRQVTITQSGDGTIVMGDQVIINPLPKPELSIYDRPTSYLRDAIANNKRQISAARSRKWLSIPSIVINLTLLIIFIFVAVVVISFFSGRDTTILLLGAKAMSQDPVYLIVFASVFCLFGVWYSRISKLEDRIIAESQEAIEHLSTILKRRKV